MVNFLIGNNEKTLNWMKENIDFESWQKIENGIAIDHHYIEGMSNIMKRQGLKVGEDFIIERF